jgi:hypothetical protein
VVDIDSVGRTSPPFSMRVELGKAREFARATSWPHPEQLQDDSPVLPTFLSTQEFWHGPEADPIVLAGLDISRSLHAEQEFVFPSGPPRVGTRLNCTTRIDQVFEKAGRRGGRMTFVVAMTEFRDEYGTLVAVSRFTGVELGDGGA